VTDQQAAGPRPQSRLVRASLAAFAVFLVQVVMPRLEEHFAEPADRWHALKGELRDYAERMS
jgi:hypothetical protein